MRKMRMLKKLLALVLVVSLTFGNITFALSDDESKVNAESAKVWNGKADTSWYKGDLDYYEISTAEELAGLAKLVNEGTRFSGVMICLTDDVILNKTSNFKKWDKKKPAHKWTMIGSKDHPFCGMFNGQGHKIEGLYIKDTKQYSNWFSTWYADAGLFGYVSNGYVVNVKMNKAYINAKGTIGTVSAFSENSSFYGIDINNVKLQGGNAGGIVGSATYDYTSTFLNIFTVIAMESMLAAGGVIINPLIFGDAVKLPDDFSGNIFFSCKVKNLKCKNTKTTGGIVAVGGAKNSGIGCLNCLVIDYSVKSDGTKGMIMGATPNKNYGVIRNCYSVNSSVAKKCSSRKFVDKKKVKKISKNTLYTSDASKFGNAFENVEGGEPRLKLFTKTKKNVDESKYKVLEDGYYTIGYGGSYLSVNDDADVIYSNKPQKFYFKYQSGGFYTITNEDGYILTGNANNDDVYAQKVEYNEHRFTQRWVLEKKEASNYIWLQDSGKAISQYSGFLFLPGTGVTLEKDWFEDVDIGHNVIWDITPAN